MADGSAELRSYASVLQTEAPLEPDAAARVVRQVAELLAPLHRSGAAHGPLSPDSVLVTSDADGRCIVRLTDADAPDTFRAPEGGAPTAASDVWSLGALLYLSLTGQDVEVTPDGVPSLQRVAPWVDGDLTQLTHGALVIDPALRCPSAGELASALAGYLSDAEPEAWTLTTVADNARARVAAVAAPVARWNAPTRPAVAGFPEALLGTELGGYRLRALLGSGGMGAVFEAEGADGVPVAVKVIRPEATTDDTVRRFAREAKSAMRIESPHVVRVFDVSTEGEMPFMVMELLKGADLAATLERTGALDPAVAARIFVEACAGLGAAHDKGLVHRDIKPGNIFLHVDDDAVTVKVCDFGIVKPVPTMTQEATELTRTGGLVGTPAYMSPEQVQDPRAVDARSDLWSLALSLYAALSGKPAWHACKNVGELMAALYTKEVPPLQDLAPWIDPQLAQVVHSGLMRDRDRRVSTAAELAANLERFAAPAPLRQSDIVGIPEGERERVAQRVSTIAGTELSPTRRATTGLMALAAVAVAAAGVFAWQRSKKQETPAAVAGCQSAAGCTAELGRAARCRSDGRCAPLASDLCKVDAEPRALESDATIWIGTMFPADHGDRNMAEFGRTAHMATSLAAREVMSIAGGITSVGGGETRPIGLVACNDAKDPKAAAEHLVNTVGVPAVIGFGSSKSVVELSTSLFLKHDVLVVPALNSSALIASIPSEKPRLVWRTAGNTTTRAQALAKVIPAYLEPRLRREVPRLTNKPLKVGLCVRHDSPGIAFSSELTQRLVFNGKSVTENGRDFRELSLLEGEESIVNDLTIADLVDFQPHVIVLQSIDDVVTRRVLSPLEERWSESVPYRPFYLVAGSLEAGALPELIRRYPTVQKRLIGVTTPSSTPANEAFTRSFNAAYGTKLAPTEAPAAPYDSVYMLVYALAAAGDGAVTGSAIAKGIEHLLPPGKAVDVGPMPLLSALTTLRKGKHIDLQGAFGRLDFDPKTGESANDCAFLCARAADEYVESGLVYDTAKDALKGEFSCYGLP